MGLKKPAEKLSDYNARLDQGKAKKIKPDHVQKILEKLRKKSPQLEVEIAREEKEDKKARLRRKIGVTREHVERAKWLLQQIEQMSLP